MEKDINMVDIESTCCETDYIFISTEEKLRRVQVSEIIKIARNSVGSVTKTSELENDSGFITKVVSDLTNYYLKTETYSQDEINQRLSAIPKFAIQVVSSLPTADINTTTVYLLKTGDESDNLYTEYIYVDGVWECLGKQTVDLSGYALQTDIPTKLSALTNDAGFITNTVSDLVNYYKKSEVYSRDEIDSKGFLTQHQDLSKYAKKATTLAGYGITDAATAEQVSRLSEGKVDKQTGYSMVSDAEKQAWNNKSNFSGNYSDLNGLPSIPSKTSDLTNDSGFITKAVGDLANYYLKNQTYSQEEIDSKLSAIPKFSIQVVATLPTADISNTTVYLLKSGEESSNLYTEYIYVNGAWEYLGKQTVDLSGYALKTDIPKKLSELTNDAGFITNAVSNLTNYYKKTEVYSRSEIDSKGFLTQHQDLSGYAKKATTLAGYGITDAATAEQVSRLSKEIDDHKEDDNVHVTSAEKQAWNNKSNFSGSYDDLTNKPSIPSLSGYATQQYVKDYAQPKGSYLTSVPSEYVTETELNNKGYATTTQLNEKANKQGLSLGVDSDGLVYLFVDGVKQGNGLEIKADVIPGDVVGYVDSDNNIILTGALADGTYTLKYEYEDGQSVVIGTLSKGSGHDIDLIWAEGVGINDATGNINGASHCAMTDFVVIEPDAEYKISCTGLNSSQNVYGRYYDSNGNYLSGKKLDNTLGPHPMVFPDGTAMFRLHCDNSSDYSPSVFAPAVKITTTKLSDIVTIPLTFIHGIKLDKTTGAESADTTYNASEFVAVDTSYLYKLYTANNNAATVSVNCFNASKSQIGYLSTILDGKGDATNITQACAELALPTGTAFIRVRVYNGGATSGNLKTAVMNRFSLLRYPR